MKTRKIHYFDFYYFSGSIKSLVPQVFHDCGNLDRALKLLYRSLKIKTLLVFPYRFFRLVFCIMGYLKHHDGFLKNWRIKGSSGS